jgi:hypothetical protein
MRTHIMQVRLTKIQSEKLKILAESAGFNTVSSYVRFMLFNPTFEIKLNRILDILKGLKK